MRFLVEITEFLCPGHHPHRAVGFHYRVGRPYSKPPKIIPHMLDLTIDTTQQVPVTLAPVDASGLAAKLDGAPTWTVSAGIATVNPAADGLSATLVSSDTPGDSQITVSADADLGKGVVTITDTITLHVDAVVVPPPQAVALGLTAGVPTPKGGVPPPVAAAAKAK